MSYPTTTKESMKLKTITLAAVIGIAAAGCSVAPASTVTSTTSTTTPKASRVDALVLTLQKRYPGASRSKIIDIAQTACSTIDEVGSIAAVIALAATDPTISVETAGDMAYVIGVAVPVYCPQYTAEIERITAE